MADITAVILAALAFGTWAVYLGGLASLQSMCVDNSGVDNTLGLVGVDGFNAFLPCSRIFSFYWFVMVFEIVAVIALACVAATDALKTCRSSYLSIFSVLTVLYIYTTHAFIDLEEIDWFDNSPQLARIRTLVAGALMTALMNGVIIVVLGFEPSSPAAEYKAKEVEVVKPAPPPATVAAATGPAEV